MLKSNLLNWLALAGVGIMAIHYLFFVNQETNDRACFNNLLRAQYDNQNVLTQNFFQVTFDPKFAKDPQGEQEALKQVFKEHFARLAALDKKFTCGR